MTGVDLSLLLKRDKGDKIFSRLTRATYVAPPFRIVRRPANVERLFCHLRSSSVRSCSYHVIPVILPPAQRPPANLAACPAPPRARRLISLAQHSHVLRGTPPPPTLTHAVAAARWDGRISTARASPCRPASGSSLSNYFSPQFRVLDLICSQIWFGRRLMVSFPHSPRLAPRFRSDGRRQWIRRRNHEEAAEQRGEEA